MKRVTMVLSGLILILLLAACGSNGEESGPAEQGGLNENYTDALSVSAQLALGTLQLEETDLAVDETQAAELLPLWQAYQSLSVSDKAAEAEVEAVLNQIQDSMTAGQIKAIAAMELTAEDATTLMQEMGDELGRGSKFGSQGGGDETGGGIPGSGGFPGGGVGGRPGGGMPGGDLGQPDADARATRIAEMGGETDDVRNTFMNRGLVNALIRSLQVKTGELDAVERD